MITGSGFTEVVDTRTGFRQHVPAHWIGDPVLGRFIEKTPAQRALDGELGPAPTEESTVPEIRAFAGEAGIDVTGLRKHAELLAAVRAVVGSDPLPEPGADAGVAVVVDPVSPGPDGEGTPGGSGGPGDEPPAGDTPPATDPAAAPAGGGTTETPAAGAKE